MVKILIDSLKNNKIGPILFIFFISLSVAILLKIFSGSNDFFLFCLLVCFYIFISILFLEIFFQIIYKFKTGSVYKKIPKIDYNKITVKPHPYLPFVYKSNFKNQGKEIINFPIKKYTYHAPELKTNSLGLYNGQYGDREINNVKKNFKINCLGASTTGNYLEHQERIYSYPIELEKILNSNDEKYEVNNCAQGGYNSADILVRFSLQYLDTKPDLVIIYHAYNDIRSYLVKNFKSDYSNSRRNLGEVMWKFYLSSIFPSSLFGVLNYLFHNWFPNNDRYSLVESISHAQNFEIEDYVNGINTFRRNLQSIIDLCKCNKIEVLLSTFCFYLHNDVKNNSLHLKLKKIVQMENNIIRDLANKNNLILVDNEKLIEKNDENFVDTIHFSHIGMEKIAQNFANQIKKIN